MEKIMTFEELKQWATKHDWLYIRCNERSYKEGEIKDTFWVTPQGNQVTIQFVDGVAQ